MVLKPKSHLKAGPGPVMVSSALAPLAVALLNISSSIHGLRTQRRAFKTENPAASEALPVPS